jgi:hypothetical protein
MYAFYLKAGMYFYCVSLPAAVLGSSLIPYILIISRVVDLKNVVTYLNL